MYLNDFYSFNLETHMWQQISTAITPSVRCYHSCVAFAGMCFVNARV